MKLLLIKTILVCAFSKACVASSIDTELDDLDAYFDEYSIAEPDADAYTYRDLLVDATGAGDDREETSRNRKLSWIEGTPRAVWLMSFPESGVAHVMNLLQQSSGMRTATNYGHILLKNDGKFERSQNSVHIYPNGPVWYNNELDTPTENVATRTHGTGYCLFCPPKQYYYGNFWWKSSSGVRMVNGTRTALQYTPSDIKKMIHLIRDPYDNVVARFASYLGLMRANRPDLKIDEKFPYNPDGFKNWCAFQDRGFNAVEMKWLPIAIREVAKDVPCRQEFVKYARFHSNAFLMARFRQIGYQVVKYDDFAKNQTKALMKMNDFLGHETIETNFEQVIPNDGIWNFREYYTNEDRVNIEKLLRNLSQPPVWAHIRDYTPAFYMDYGGDADLERESGVGP